MLRDDFVVGWKNIIEEDYVGESYGYAADQTSVGTTNGAGAHNVQIFVLSPDAVVLHALPGFWHPEDLARELDLAKRLYDVWRDERLSLAAKKAKFTRMQLAAAKNQSITTLARSRWQGFDAREEQMRLAKGVARDTLARKSNGKLDKDRHGHPRMKPTIVVAHERMAARPFVPFARFDTARFADYGRIYYDNNRRVDGKGITFMTPRRLAEQAPPPVQRYESARARQVVAKRPGRPYSTRRTATAAGRTNSAKRAPKNAASGAAFLRSTINTR